MKQLTLKRLESDKVDLENQGKGLIAQKKELEKRILEVVGALMYVEKRIKTLKGEDDQPARKGQASPPFKRGRGLWLSPLHSKTGGDMYGLKLGGNRLNKFWR